MRRKKRIVLGVVGALLLLAVCAFAVTKVWQEDTDKVGQSSKEVQLTAVTPETMEKEMVDGWLADGPFIIEAVELPQEAKQIVNDLEGRRFDEDEKEQTLVRARQIFAFLLEVGQSPSFKTFLQRGGGVALDRVFDRFTPVPILELTWDIVEDCPGVFYGGCVGHMITLDELSEGADRHLLYALVGLGMPREILERLKEKRRYLP